MTERGIFIVIDGTDGSGKTEQTKLLVERLRAQGRAVEEISFPRYGKKSAGPVEDYLSGSYGTPDEVGAKRASMMYALDRYGASMEIEAWLADGRVVIANRYVASNMGHQGSKIDDAERRMAFFLWNEKLEYEDFAIPRPNINVILHVPVDISLELIDKRGRPKDAHENREHLTAAERTYLEIAGKFPGFSLVECAPGGTLLSIPEVHERVWAIVRPLLAA